MRKSASGRWQGRVRRSPSAVMQSLSPCTSPAETGRRCARALAGDHIAHNVGAFLGLQRADAIDEGAARLGRSGARASSRLDRGELGDVASRFATGTSGWRRTVPVATGGIEQDGVEGPPRATRRRRRRRLGAQSRSRARFSPSRSIRSAERSTAVTWRRPRRAARSCRRAPRRDRHALAARLAQQARRHGGGGVLHPPGAVGVAGQRSIAPPGRPRTVPVGSTRPPQRVRPAWRHRLDGEIERRLVSWRRRWARRSPRHRLSSSEPSANRACRARCVVAGRCCLPSRGDAPEHRIDQASS